jgi:hypothetical protein
MKDIRLSKNLMLTEMTRSENAKRRGISNQATKEHIENMKILAEKVFQPIRDHFKVPIRISSGYRSRELNAIIGGSQTSQHSEGKAIDIDMDGTKITNKQIFDFIRNNLEFCDHAICQNVVFAIVKTTFYSLLLLASCLNKVSERFFRHIKSSVIR